MRIRKEGEKIVAVCNNCAMLVDATYVYRDVRFSDGSGEVKDVLAAVCNTCNEVVAIPARNKDEVALARPNDITLEEAFNIAFERYEDTLEELAKK